MVRPSCSKGCGYLWRCGWGGSERFFQRLRSGRRAGDRAKLGVELVDQRAQGGFGLEAGVDALERVHDRGVITALERAGDLRQRVIGQAAREVHRELSRLDHLT